MRAGEGMHEPGPDQPVPCRGEKLKDPTIRERFDSYRFADHKERVIDLLARVATVSVETVRIFGAMRAGTR